jgi:MFS family permease
MLALVGLTVVSAVVYFQNSITLPLAVTGSGLATSVYGMVMAVNGVLIVLLQPFMVRQLPRFERTRMLALGAALVGLGFWLTTFAHSAWAYALTVVVWTAGEIVQAGLALSLVADLAPPEARGRYTAVWGSSFGIAAFVAPPVGTWTYQYLGPAALWTACLVAGLAVAAGFVALGPAVAHRTKGLPAHRY